MLTLRSSPASPFGRKVKIAASLLGLSDRIEIVSADTTDPSDSLRQQNPLGKIPALILESGRVIYDSRVIVEYLDFLAGGEKLYPVGEERFAALTHHALADGIMDAALLQVYEGRFRAPDKHEPKWVESQAGKVSRGLAVLEEKHGSALGQIHVGHIAQACALGYLDLRFAGTWRESYPKLVAWLAEFESRVPAYDATRFKG
jgi:glutathione S-transferase